MRNAQLSLSIEYSRRDRSRVLDSGVHLDHLFDRFCVYRLLHTDPLVQILCIQITPTPPRSMYTIMQQYQLKSCPQSVALRSLKSSGDRRCKERVLFRSMLENQFFSTWQKSFLFEAAPPRKGWLSQLYRYQERSGSMLIAGRRGSIHIAGNVRSCNASMQHTSMAREHCESAAEIHGEKVRIDVSVATV